MLPVMAAYEPFFHNLSTSVGVFAFFSIKNDASVQVQRIVIEFTS